MHLAGTHIPFQNVRCREIRATILDAIRYGQRTGTEASLIDALAVDEHLRPVVVEYKREATGSTDGQALAYVEWVLGHRDAVALRVARQLGVKVADRID